MGKATFSERLNLVIKENNIRQVDLCRKTGIGKSAMSQYLSGSFAPKQQNLYELARALNVSEAWLMGYDVPRERTAAKAPQGSSEAFYFTAPDDSMLNMHIPKGARVLIQKTDFIESGQVVCLTASDSKPCLRKLHRQNDLLLFIAASSSDEYPPLICKNSDLSDGSLKIKGVAVEVAIDL
ncbi:MAG TPA: helix-turn-helix domain-containing protein [Candidatus Copromorpha excrementigallinarum]|uniref:Helix-turn-helix domain-containing protein n=1 Tax=Candidatus Allocopromorpha excrementigallinarum TaxID=2840742 RepID=A0A9D1HYW6_9FIRM|nr:helix-turn-helix domain-containing protein [Candidatus Copromorpha excrementigallinarum]